MNQSDTCISHKIINPYLGMINDKWRNQFYFDALKKHALDKVVLDVGTGTGILAFYALRFGARYVYCIERGGAAAQVADRILADNFERSRFEVLNLDFWTNAIDNKIHEPVDILVSETVGPGLFDQGMFHTWVCAQPFLTANAISIPDRLHFDLWFWERDKSSDIMSSKFQQRKEIFFPDATLDKDFAKSLMVLDKEFKLSNESDTLWCKVNNITSDPYRIDADQVVYSMHQLPPLNFSSRPYPQHIIPDIEFTVDVHDSGFMSIINKISFEDKTLFLKDASWMPWKYAPTFKLQEPGEYQFCYNNPDLDHMSHHEWQFEKRKIDRLSKISKP